MPKGVYTRRIEDPSQRFWSKVEKTDNCWIWKASKRRGGYGQFWFDGVMKPAHRIAYELEVGKIPKDLTIDHLCRNRSCVNFKHLEAVTNKVNILRGNGIPSINAKKTHCKNGHEFTRENTYVWNNNMRQCRKCKKAIKTIDKRLVSDKQ